MFGSAGLAGFSVMSEPEYTSPLLGAPSAAVVFEGSCPPVGVLSFTVWTTTSAVTASRSGTAYTRQLYAISPLLRRTDRSRPDGGSSVGRHLAANGSADV